MGSRRRRRGDAAFSGGLRSCLKSKAVTRVEPEEAKPEYIQQVFFFCIADSCFSQGAGIGILVGALAAVFILAAVAFRCCSPAARAAKRFLVAQLRSRFQQF